MDQGLDHGYDDADYTVDLLTPGFANVVSAIEKGEVHPGTAIAMMLMTTVLIALLTGASDEFITEIVHDTLQDESEGLDVPLGSMAAH